MKSNLFSFATGRVWTERAHARHSIEGIGTLTRITGPGSLDCLVEDVSLGGARVYPTEQVMIGQRFRLSIRRFNFTAPIKVVWATQDGVGVMFAAA
jgi:hypothetical protein